MRQTLYFYDLETSGFRARSDRIMQFAGQRTDMDLRPVGEPDNMLIKLSEDVLPSPDAILVTGITPQKTLQDGFSEIEFLKHFEASIAIPGTVFVGFNNVRFDDEFMRHLRYRNFFDAFDWQWKDSRGRWDLLDVVRMTRALRPEGIVWPYDSSGKPSCRLELLASSNKLQHDAAHDALSDVRATIALARLLRDKQPKLFDYLLSMRSKSAIEKLVASNQPFVYSSGKYSGEHEKTTVAIRIAAHPKKQGSLVFDLRSDPTEFFSLSPEQLVDRWKYSKDAVEARLPIKTLQYNRCPAVAPLGVFDEESQQRLGLTMKHIEENIQKLKDSRNFVNNILKALEIMDVTQQSSLLQDERNVDEQLYDGFFNDADQAKMKQVRDNTSAPIDIKAHEFSDARLNALLPLYKARNFPKTLTDEERAWWDQYKTEKISRRLPEYMGRIRELQATAKKPQTEYILQELYLYGESLSA